MGKRKKSYFFEDIPVLGKLPLEERAKKFREVGDTETARSIMDHVKALSKGKGLFGRDERPCEDTAHAFGFIPPSEDDFVEITHAGKMEPDGKLIGKRVKITLDCLRAADYPGKGVHRVLFDFFSKNQISAQQTEEIHFNQTYRVKEGQAAGVIGYPVFKGLNVGQDGLEFKCYTVNVQNDDDERILNFLESDVFKTGLTLVTTAQPAIAPLTGLAIGITKMVASRNKNVPVQDFFMGLDFTKTPGRARLAQGAYVAVQIPQKFQANWNWNDWIYDQSNGWIVHETDKKTLIPHNYVQISVSEYKE